MNPNLFIWTSDWHVGRGGFTLAQTQAMVAHIVSLDPAGVIDTGDAKEDFGNLAQMQDYETSVRGALPWALVNGGVTALQPILPGNHDEMTDYLITGPGDFSQFNSVLWGPPYHWTCDWAAPQIRFIGFHSRIVHSGEGPALPFNGFFVVENAERDWLAAELDALPADWLAIVCSHAPLAPSFGNNIGIWANYNGTEIQAILRARKDKIVAYFNGHRHSNMDTAVLDGIPHFNGPGVSYTGGNGNGGFVPVDYDSATQKLTIRYHYARSPFASYAGSPAYSPHVIQLSDASAETFDPGSQTISVARRYIAFSLALLPVPETTVPTPGGALAGGRALVARAAAVASGSLAQGRSPVICVALSQGGALAAGFAPNAQGPALGAAFAFGNEPTKAIASVPQGGALAVGNALQGKTVLSRGGALAEGTAPIPPAPVFTPARGGAIAQGVAATAASPLNVGFGNDPFGEGGFGGGIRGRAVAGGNAPAVGGITQVLPQGGAIAQGNAPGTLASSTVPQGGALAGGNAPVSAARGQALAQGASAVARAIVSQGGAIAQGNAPQENIATAVPQGGAVAAGVEATAVVIFLAGGADATSLATAAAITVAAGGALAGGNEPAGTIAAIVENVPQGGADAGSHNIEEPVIVYVLPGGAIAAGTPPTELTNVIIVTGHFDASTPNSGHFDAPTPAQVA